MPDCLTTRRPDVLGGTPVFAGTRVPVRYLFDWLEGGETLEWFLDSYPSVSRAQAMAALQMAAAELEKGAHEVAV
ncbi:MAG: DUF433 domain-containing protein [Gammaproteobacteria bacterium]|nr:DUF433 domain-containing protein [Gammaproteobacteria bacterium]